MTLPPRSPFDLSDHVSLVTGGNSGIGLGMAEALAAHGADVAIWGTNPDKNDAAVDVLSRYDVGLLSVVCDVGNEAAVIEAMSDTIDEFGRIDSCFVNAGIGGRATSFVGGREQVDGDRQLVGWGDDSGRGRSRRIAALMFTGPLVVVIVDGQRGES